MLRLDDDLINCSLSLLIPAPVAFTGATKRSTHAAGGGEKRKEIAVITFLFSSTPGIEVCKFPRATKDGKRENLIKWKYIYNEQSKKNPEIRSVRQGQAICLSLQRRHQSSLKIAARSTEQKVTNTNILKDIKHISGIQTSQRCHSLISYHGELMRCLVHKST